MSKLIVEMFCPQAGGSAGEPGATPVNSVRLQTPRPKKSDDFDKKIFAAVTGNGALSLGHVTDEATGFFKPGARYRVTIEPVDKPAAPS